MPTPVRAELLRVAGLPSRTFDSWRAMAGRAVEPNPWFEPELLVPLQRHRIPALTVVLARRGDEVVGCLALKPMPGRWRRLPVAVWGVPHPLGTPLVDEDDAEAALAAMLDAVARHSPQLFLVWRAIGSDGPVMRTLDSALASTRTNPIHIVNGTWPRMERGAAWVNIGPTGAVDESRRKLSEALGEAAVTRDHADDPLAVDRFLQVEAAGPKGRAGLATIQQPGAPEYFRDVCDAFRRQGRLRMLALEGGGTTVAMKCEVSAGPGLFEMKAAADDRFAEYAPRAVLEADVARQLADDPYEWAVSTSLEDTSPLEWLWPDRQRWTDLRFRLAGAARALQGLSRGFRRSEKASL
jgi:hypothetical protein